MNEYYIEYNYPKWGNSGGFEYSPDYYKYKTIVLKAKDLNTLRVRIIRELAKGKPFRSHVYRIDATGLPNYDSPLGDLYHYPRDYVWFIRSTKGGWAVNPMTGKRKR